MFFCFLNLIEHLGREIFWILCKLNNTSPFHRNTFQRFCEANFSVSSFSLTLGVGMSTWDKPVTSLVCRDCHYRVKLPLPSPTIYSEEPWRVHIAKPTSSVHRTPWPTRDTAPPSLGDGADRGSPCRDPGKAGSRDTRPSLPHLDRSCNLYFFFFTCMFCTKLVKGLWLAQSNSFGCRFWSQWVSSFHGL